MTHDFTESRDRAISPEREVFWENVYRRAFTGYQGMVSARNDTQAQILGIDRWVTLGCGAVRRIDEKNRDRCADDILLEYCSNDATGAPGWIEKDLQVDYVAYAFHPSRTCHLLPWSTLRAAWLRERNTWKQLARDEQHGFRLVRAANKSYTTHNLAVPIKRLYSALNRACVIEVCP